MKIFKAYFAGLKSAGKSQKTAAVIYAVIFLLALVLAIPFHTALLSQTGNSIALHALLKHFNYTIFSDFMNSSGKVINIFILAALWMGIFYFLFTVFFTGGILNVLSNGNGKFSIMSFLWGCGKYFFRFFRLGIYLLIIQFLMAVIIFFPLSKILSANYEVTLNEASLFYIFLTGVLIFAVIFILILIIGDYAKIILFNNDSKKVIRAIGKSFQFVFKHLSGTYTLYILILTAPVLLIIFYFLLDNAVGMISGFTIFIMFLIQQAFIWLRILIKIWFLGSELSFYKNLNEYNIQ
jgi:hypothetical protein